MAGGPFILDRPEHSIPLEAATTLLPKQLVRLVGTNTPLVAPCATTSHEPFGHVDATYAAGEIAAVYEEANYRKVVAGASLGVGDVVVGSANGALLPYVAASVFAASGHFVAGKAFTPAAAGETFTLFIKPKKAS